MTVLLKNRKFCVVMRNEKSIAAVYGFVSGLGASISDFYALVLEREKDSAVDFEAKKENLYHQLAKTDFDALILATKVNDFDDKSHLPEFLSDLKAKGLGQTPVILTHLSEMNAALKSDLSKLQLNLRIVEHDNLGFPKDADGPQALRTGMSQLAPEILAVCNA